MYHLSVNIIFVCLNILFNTLASIRSKKIAENNMINPYNPLPDIIQNNFISTQTHLPDYLILISFILFIIKNIYLYNYYILYLNLYTLNLSLLLRSITISVTILPSCMPIHFFNNNNLYQQLFNSSHDLMFSGHTILFIFLSNIINHHNLLLHLSSIIIKYLFPISLITSKQHYTIDVIIAMIIYRYFKINIEYYNLLK